MCRLSPIVQIEHSMGKGVERDMASVPWTGTAQPFRTQWSFLIPTLFQKNFVLYMNVLGMIQSGSSSAIKNSIILISKEV